MHAKLAGCFRGYIVNVAYILLHIHVGCIVGMHKPKQIQQLQLYLFETVSV